LGGGVRAGAGNYPGHERKYAEQLRSQRHSQRADNSTLSNPVEVASRHDEAPFHLSAARAEGAAASYCVGQPPGMPQQTRVRFRTADDEIQSSDDLDE